jgi:hypothetical protein
LKYEKPNFHIMKNLKNLEIQVLIDMIVEKTTQYTVQLKNRDRTIVGLHQSESEISSIAGELLSRKPNK